MISLDPLELVLFFITGIFAGLVESTAGGSGLLVLPALLFAGFSPLEALGTSKLQYFFGALVSIGRYSRAQLTRLPHLKLYSLIAITMGAAGALILVNTQLPYLNYIIPIFLLASAIYFARSSRVKDEASIPQMGTIGFALGPIALIAFYDGFLGTGSGSFYVIALIWGLGLSTLHATACTKIIDFCSGLAALAILIWHGHVIWNAGILLGAGQMIGAWFGAGLVIRKGTRILRPLLIGVSVLMCLKLLWDAING